LGCLVKIEFQGVYWREENLIEMDGFSSIIGDKERKVHR
jgi:hypothetical protein